jgi:cobalt-precorrin 5A hydrolase
MRIAGLGFRKSATTAQLAEALHAAGGAGAVATAWDKAAALAPLGLPIHAVALDALIANARPGSPRVHALYGTGSLAESAALAAAGPGATLIQPRRSFAQGAVVVAIAETSP